MDGFAVYLKDGFAVYLEDGFAVYLEDGFAVYLEDGFGQTVEDVVTVRYKSQIKLAVVHLGSERPGVRILFS